MRHHRPSALLAALLCATSASADQARVEKNVFVSESPARLTLTLDPSFQYLGSFPFDIRGIAGGTRYVWGDADRGKHLKRTFIVQVEGYSPDNDYSYTYPSPTPVSLAGQAYQHDVSIYDNDESARRHPGNEPDLTRQFLSGLGYAWGPQLVMSRFARVVDDARRNEILFFYFENLEDHTSRPASAFPDEGRSFEQRTILETVDTRSRKAFTVTR